MNNLILPFFLYPQPLIKYLLLICLSMGLPINLFSQNKKVANSRDTTENLAKINTPGGYIPLLPEGRTLIYRGYKIDLDMRYNIITDSPAIHGFTFGGNFAVIMNNVHEFGGALSWSTFSTNRVYPNKPTFGWETKLGFFYRFNARFDAFSFNFGVQTGPAIFGYTVDDYDNPNLYFFYYIQPEIDLELRILEHFATSLMVGYSMHMPILGTGYSPFISHVTMGITWRWYEVD